MSCANTNAREGRPPSRKAGGAHGPREKKFYRTPLTASYNLAVPAIAYFKQGQVTFDWTGLNIAPGPESSISRSTSFTRPRGLLPLLLPFPLTSRLVAMAAEKRLSFPAIRCSPAAAIAQTIAIYLLGRTHKPLSVSGSVNVRFDPKATEVLRCRELTRAINGLVHTSEVYWLAFR